MSVERCAERLLRAYPVAWRRRYGEELAALIVEASEGEKVSWRTRLDVLSAGGRERLRPAGLQPGGSAANRVRASILQALFGWALFVLGGMIVGKFSEHWHATLPTDGSAPASAAFTVLLVGACCGSALVVAGVIAALPSFVRFVRRGRTPEVRGPIRRSALATGAALGATAVLAIWGGSLTAAGREGGDGAYAVAFVAWALVVAAMVVVLAASAASVASRLDLSDRALRIDAWLAAGTAAAMATVSAATIVWWVALADAAPWVLSGGAAGRRGSALAPPLIVAVAMMLSGAVIGVAAARRALGELPALARPPSGSR